MKHGARMSSKYKYNLVLTSKFKRDAKRMKKRGAKRSELDAVVEVLRKGEKLDLKHKDHQLKGNMKDHRECHIKPDWLLVYKIDKGNLILILTDTGSHADLFNM